MSARTKSRPRAPRTTSSIVASDKAVTVSADSDFSRSLTALIDAHGIRRVIETGTYFGTGTTRTIARALQAGGVGGVCYSIEVNPVHHRYRTTAPRPVGATRHASDT